MDWEAEGLLDGVDGAARAARAGLLDDLAAHGIALDELRLAVAQDRLALLLVERVLLGEPRYTPNEVAEKSGVSLEDLLNMRRAAGIPVTDLEAVSLSDDDLENAHRTRQFLDAGLPLEALLGVTRVMGDSMMRSAEAIRSMFGRAYLEPGDTERDVSERYTQMSEALLPVVVPVMEYLLRAHLREFTRNDVIGLAERSSGSISETSDVAVGFADLVGFSRLGEQLGVEELGDVATRLTGLARERIELPVRLVKTIGDAVMLVSTEPAALVDVMLDLVEAVREAGDLPPLRAGIAWGPAVSRYGDWYGGTVNLAARVADRARPDSVLAAEGLKDALEGAEHYEWSFAGEKKLKNLAAEARLYRVRRV